MKICIVAATMEEVKPFVERHKIEEACSRSLYGHEVEFLVTGTGISAMIYFLLHHVLFRRADFYILAGIAGALKKNLPIGAVVEVISDVYGDLGAQEMDGTFLTLDDMGLNTEPDLHIFTTNFIKNSLEKVLGITVHQTLGTDERIEQIVKLYDHDLCTMEGAAFHYVMSKKDIPAIHIRAISSYIGQGLDKWNLPMAIRNLNLFLNSFLKETDFSELY